MDDVGIGRTLRALRIRARLTQRQAASRAGISQATWSRIERGHLAQVSTAMLRRAFAANKPSIVELRFRFREP